MRRALFSAALTFSFLMTPVALAQTAGSGASGGTSAQGTTPLPENQQGRGVSGDTSVQPPGTYESGNFSPVPQGATGAEDNLGTPNTDYSGTGGSGASDPRYTPPSPGTSFVPQSSDVGGTAGTGGSGTTTHSNGNTATDNNSNVSGTQGTGGSGNTNNTPAQNQGSGNSVPSGRAPSTSQGTEPTDAAGDAHGGSAEAAASGKDLSPRQLTREVAMLRSDVLRLQRQVNALRGGHADKQDEGTGGSGQTASGQNAPPEQSASSEPARDTGANPEKTVVASVVMTGQVASTSKGRVVVRDSETGDLYNLRVGQNTQVVRDGQRISLDSLPQGTAVQAAFSLIADGSTDATRIQVTPSPRPRSR
ncbi:hypothetical protein [Myxococcus qinghaiensis]|uniref:hypothetical protein n=1 Tax=Myxococcus qinghaiensis TaxID=2906758 RepID=UPI0020A75879|nr:hypothetical protein [Myxococcus qinghaiensis]MCP3165335.1 hypothetical protein [Myxococcus qinghaiensis]